MVNLRYFISILGSKIEESTSNVIAACMFLTDADISFFESKDCLISINSTDITHKYNVELDRKRLLALCN